MRCESCERDDFDEYQIFTEDGFCECCDCERKYDAQISKLEEQLKEANKTSEILLAQPRLPKIEGEPCDTEHYACHCILQRIAEAESEINMLRAHLAEKTELLGETHMRVMVWEARAREAVCSGRGHAAAIRDVYDEAPALLAKLRGV
ncbi:MAG: hypothetical protein WC476_00855 [Phycisphaerae bacterium]|jgi:hypothetical protein